MNRIKLSATTSTNDYLKDFYIKKELQNHTIVVTKKQTNGRGQSGSSWHSEEDKNLTFSILEKDFMYDSDTVFLLNVAVALAVRKFVSSISKTKISIKWPNDILADSKKIAGILIENTIKSDGTFVSIIGIGINCNQTEFSEEIKATSLTKINNQLYDLDFLLNEFETVFLEYIAILKSTKKKKLWEEYHNNLFKIKCPMVFENMNNQKFMGIIQGVSPEGKLMVLLENDSIVYFGIKEIKMCY